MNFMLLLPFLDNSLNISSFKKQWLRQPVWGQVAKIVHLYRQCQINENKLKTDVCCVYKYLKTVHTSPSLSQTAVLIL